MGGLSRKKTPVTQDSLGEPCDAREGSRKTCIRPALGEKKRNRWEEVLYVVGRGRVRGQAEGKVQPRALVWETLYIKKRKNDETKDRIGGGGRQGARGNVGILYIEKNFWRRG